MQSIDEETKEVSVWVENFKIIEINMERLKKMCYDRSIIDIEKYAYLMMIDMNEEELHGLLHIRKGDEILMEFTDKVCRMNKNPNFINTVGKEKERVYAFNTAVELAHEDGLEKGREEGLEKAREEKNRLIKAMASNGVKVSDIATICGLTKEEVDKILND